MKDYQIASQKANNLQSQYDLEFEMLPFDESIPSLINEGISVDTATINKLDTQFKFPSGHH